MKARQPRQVGLVVYLMQNLRLRGRPPSIIFARIVRPINALQLCRFTQRNFLAEFIQSKCDFNRHAAVSAFWNPPLRRLGTTYDVHLWLIGKRVADFLLVLIELFSLGVTVEVLRAKIDQQSAISLQRGHFHFKFQVEGDVPHQ